MSHRKRGSNKPSSSQGKNPKDDSSSHSEAIEERIGFADDEAPEEPEPEGEDLQEKMEE